ncbi:MAG: phosphoglucosamine mutase [Candidatus Micrarchaeota archaeon]
MAKYFGTNGIRAKLDIITPEFVSRMSFAFGVFCKRGRVILARDTRVSGPMLHSAAIAGLISAGCEAIDLGIAPAPTVELMVKRLKADGGITITASHNPPEWNALKFVDKNSVAVSWERGEEIEKIFEDSSVPRAEWNKLGKATAYSLAIEDHINEILEYVDQKSIQKKRPHIVLDCANGTGALFAPTLFRKLGCKILTLNAQPDGFFPGHNSEPTPENLADLIAAVKATGADMGIAWDGDCDRVIFIDEKGNYVIGDKSYALSVEIALSENKQKHPKVVTTVATTDMIKDIAKRHGAEIIYTKVGGPYLAEELLNCNAVTGGEEAGGIIWPALSPGKDGFATAVKILEWVCKSNKPLSQHITMLPEYYNSKVRIPCTKEQKFAVIEKLKKEPLEKGTEALTLDGIRINSKDGWVILRPSGTEHLIRIFAEAKTQEKAKEIMEKYETKVRVLL